MNCKVLPECNVYIVEWSYFDVMSFAQLFLNWPVICLNNDYIKKFHYEFIFLVLIKMKQVYVDGRSAFLFNFQLDTRVINICIRKP